MIQKNIQEMNQKNSQKTNQENIMSNTNTNNKTQSAHSTPKYTPPSPKNNPNPNRKENRQINIRVSEDEYERLSAMANDLGISVAHFCKNKVLGIKTKAPKINREAGMGIARELRKIGVNLNQIAKGVNTAWKDGEFPYAVMVVDGVVIGADEAWEVFERIRREFEEGMVKIWGLIE